ncbi:ribonuclease P protein component [Mycoplasma parvum]|uniref:Ribonuclease P protein component n=1 Tax=Mycoplasma parvum str. Indiana TaxID=1403316 RepID=U5NDG6_9MOLU|nr:ribonuclease P protein component [Mycoplasma parvum]AGX89345.1 hypothetical protein PRV_03100 [Mycoplasma parvum str. Indiana]
MKKKYRLRKITEFKEVLRKGKSIKTSNLIFIYLPKQINKENSKNNIKIGIIIPKKKCKKAVDRNYLKRVIWAIHSNIQLNNLPSCFSIFLYTSYFYSRYQYKKIDFLAIEKDIKKIYSILLKKCS